jgi:hypothetical protein
VLHVTARALLERISGRVLALRDKRHEAQLAWVHAAEDPEKSAALYAEYVATKGAYLDVLELYHDVARVALAHPDEDGASLCEQLQLTDALIRAGFDPREKGTLP